jgi:hypothetical protein
MERWVRACRREPLDRTLIWDRPRLLQTTLREFEQFYGEHRPHQGMGCMDEIFGEGGAAPPREADVVRLVAKGLSNRAALIAWAWRHGLAGRLRLGRPRDPRSRQFSGPG